MRGRAANTKSANEPRRHHTSNQRRGPRTDLAGHLEALHSRYTRPSCLFHGFISICMAKSSVEQHPCMENPACDGTPSAEEISSGPEVVFTADFASTRQWVAGRSWAYPNGGPVNPGDNKLDYLTADPAYSRSGTFRATLRKDGRWDTGLLTTEGSEEAFTVRAGDVLEARVRLPYEAGAW